MRSWSLSSCAGIGLPVDLVELPGFGARRLTPVGSDAAEPPAAVAAHLDDRMNDEVHGQLGAGEHDPDRVDEEWLVVGDDHDEGVRRLEAVARLLGIEHLHQRLSGRAPS